MMLNLDKRMLLVLAVLMMLVLIPASFAADADVDDAISAVDTVDSVDVSDVGVEDVSAVDTVSDSAVDTEELSDGSLEVLGEGGSDYKTTPSPTEVTYTRGEDCNITVTVSYNDYYAYYINDANMLAYINCADDSDDGVEITTVSYTKAKAISTFKFNLKQFSDKLVDGTNTIKFHPEEWILDQDYAGTNDYLYVPLTVTVGAPAPSYDYETSVDPVSVEYTKGESSEVTVTADFDTQYAEDLDFSSMFAWINGEGVNDRFLINGVTGGATSFTFDLADISDKLNVGENTITFHPTTAIIEDTFYSTNYNFNPLTVIVSEDVPSYDYETSVYPAAVDYVKGTSSIVTVTAECIDFGDLEEGVTTWKVYINGDTNGILTEVDAMVKTFTFDLATISDNLNVGENTILFHPNQGTLENWCYFDTFNYNPLTVTVSEPASYAWTIQGKTGGYETLAEAVAAAESGDTIVGAQGTVETISPQLRIAKNVNIIAANLGDVILKGENLTVLNISNGYTVNLENITFKDYQVPGSMNVKGAAIYNNGTMSVTSCSFENINVTGTSSNYAPAIYNYGNMTVDNCLFDSLSGYYGAPIYSYYYGTSAPYVNSNITVSNSVFRNINSRYGCSGVYLYRAANGKIINCTFEDMTIAQPVIYINDISPIIENCTFKNIQATISSTTYAVILNGQQLTNNVTFVGNLIDNVTATGSASSNGGISLIMSRGSASNGVSSNISNNIIRNSKVTNTGTSANCNASLIYVANGNVNYNLFYNNEISVSGGKAYDVLGYGGTIDGNYNYWNSNEGPNATSYNNGVTVSNWMIISADIPDPIIVGSTEDISIILKANDTSGTVTDLPAACGTITLPVSSVLNSVASDVEINGGTGTITYRATQSGDETLTVLNNPFTFEVSADASTLIYVDAVAGSDSGTGATDSPFKTIAKALSVATTGKTIIIRSGTYTEKDLEVTADITIKADKNAEVVIDANKEGRIFIIKDDAVLTLRDLTLVNGLIDYYDDPVDYDGKGGAILIDMGSLIANNINIYNSSAATGGAIASIAMSTGKIEISNSKFIDNSIDESEDAYYGCSDLLGGGAIYADCDLILTNCQFINNKASNDETDVYGGAIYLISNANITGCTFEGSYADKDGGAIYVDAYNTAVVIISGNTFTGSEAEYNGGTIYAGLARSVTISDNTFKDSKAYNGGVIYLNAAPVTFTISGNNFDNSSATNGGTLYINNGVVALTQNTIGTSNASNSGKKIYVAHGSVNSVLTFLGNTTVAGELGSEITLTATVTDDMGNEIRGGSITFTADGTTVDTVDISWTNEPETTFTIPADATENILISGSYSLDNGGTVKTGVVHPAILNWFIEGGNGYELLSDAIAAAVDGDVIYANPGTYVISSLNVNKNVTIKANETGQIILDGNRNRIFNINGNVNLVNLTFINGSLSSSGGLINIAKGNVTIESCLFTNHSGTSGSGSAIYIESQCNKLTINDSVFDNIYAGTGLIYNKYTGAEIFINNTDFTNLNINSNGAVYLYEGRGEISNSRFINITGGRGAAIYFWGKDGNIVTGCIFENVNGSDGIIYSSGKTADVNYNIFVGNNYGIYASTANQVNADYNYWGNNSGPTDNTKVTCDYWTILDLTAESTTVSPGQNVPITVDFTKCTDGTNILALEEAMPEYTFDLISSEGLIDSHVTVSEGTGAAVYGAPLSIEVGSEVTIYITPGDETLVLTVIKAPAATNLAAEDVTITVGSGSLTATLTADGVAVPDKVISIRIGGGTLTGTTDANGVATIDLSDVPVGVYENVNVAFSGDDDYAASTATVTITVEEIPVPVWFIGETGYVTLADAVAAAVDGDVIIGLSGTYEIDNVVIDKDVTIKANESDEIILQAASTRIATVAPGKTVNFENLIMEKGKNKLGGILNVTNATANIDNCIFRDTSLSGSTGTTCAINAVDANLTIKNSKFDNINVTSTSYSGAYVGAIYALRSNVNITNTNFTNIKAGQYTAAALFVSGSETTIKDSEFSNSIVATGAIYAYGGNTFIDNTKFIANNGTMGPGGIFGAGAATSGANITVTNSLFKDLLASGNGGAISTTGNLLVVEQSVFMNNRLNRTTNNGGAIYLSGNATINYNVFLNNSDNRATPQGNDIYQSASTKYVNADYNYFGSNDKPDNTSINKNVDLTKWVILDLSADKNPAPDEAISLIADLTTYTDGETNGTVAKLLPELEFTVSAVNGTVDPAAITISPDTQGKATITYTAPDAIGDDVVSLKLFDEEVANLAITIEEPKVETSLAADDVTVTVGSGSLVATLTADGVGVPGKTIAIRVEGGTLAGTTDANGVATIDLSSLPVGTYNNVEVKFAGDDDYEASSATVTITVNKYATILSASDVTITVGSGSLVATLTADGVGVPGKTIAIRVEGGTLAGTTDANGVATIDLSSLPVGTYNNVEVKFAGDESYEASSAIVVITVNNIETALTVENVSFEVGSGALTATLTADGAPVAGKTLKVTVDTINATAITDASGVATVDLSSLAIGTYTANIIFEGDAVYATTSAEATVTVTKVKKTAKDLQDLIDAAPEGSVVDLGEYEYENVSNVNITKDITLMGNGTTITGAGDGSPIFNIVPKSEDGPDEVNITNIEFKVNNADTIVKAVAENDTISTSIDVASINFSNNTVTAANDDVVPESVTVLELESERGVLAPTGDISIKDNTMDAGIKPFKFDVTSVTDESGNVDIPSGPITPERTETEIVYQNMTTTAVDVDTDGRIGKYFYITLKDKNGNLLKNKPIQIGFNGVVYDRTTDENGSARLQINLKNAGTYTFAVSYLGDDTYNGSFIVAKIVVNKQKGSLTVPNKSYKATASTKSLTATFKSASGKVVKGKKITFTVNGKSYSATTNAKGVATVKVSLNTKGTYSFTAKFAGNTMYAAISKTATLKLT